MGDGIDVWQALVQGTPTPRHEVFYNPNPLCGQWQAKPPTAAIRVGAWKLMTWCYNVTGVGGAETTGPVNAPMDAGFPDFATGPVLFNLEEDPEESVNLASFHPDQVGSSGPIGSSCIDSSTTCGAIAALPRRGLFLQ